MTIFGRFLPKKLRTKNGENAVHRNSEKVDFRQKFKEKLEYVCHVRCFFEGYENEACEQSKSVETTLRMLCSPGPGVLVLIYCFFIWMYPITDETCRNNKRILHERHLREIEMKKYQKYVDRSFQFENEAIEPL